MFSKYSEPVAFSTTSSHLSSRIQKDFIKITTDLQTPDKPPVSTMNTARSAMVNSIYYIITFIIFLKGFSLYPKINTKKKADLSVLWYYTASLTSWTVCTFLRSSNSWILWMMLFPFEFLDARLAPSHSHSQLQSMIWQCKFGKMLSVLVVRIQRSVFWSSLRPIDGVSHNFPSPRLGTFCRLTTSAVITIPWC